ncbi:MAG: hypothetical protein ACTHNW_03820, partial [Mucilaginibacter sp.]
RHKWHRGYVWIPGHWS